VPDAYEPDDDTAQSISDADLPLSQARTLDAQDYDANSVDWDGYELTGTAGTLYTFDTSGDADTIMFLQDETSGEWETLGWNDDKNDSSSGSTLTWRCTASGHKVTVWVGPYNDISPIGDYTMSITAATDASLPGNVERVYGSTKSGAAVTMGKYVYWDYENNLPWHYYTSTGKKNVSNVYVVSCDSNSYVAAMITQPLASINNAPILLVTRTSLPSATKSAITAIKKNNGGKVYIHVVGPTSWVSSSVYTKLKALKGTHGTIERISADDRYALSVKIADKVDAKWVAATSGSHASAVFVANGSSTSALTDLLITSGIAASRGWPILLTKSTSLPSSAYSRLSTGKFSGSSVIVPNCASYVDTATYTRASGDLRLSTHSERAASALDIARQSIGHAWCTQSDVLVINKVADALTSGTYAGEYSSVVLVSGTNGPVAATSDYFNARSGLVDYVTACAPSSGISADALEAYDALIH